MARQRSADPFGDAHEHARVERLVAAGAIFVFGSNRVGIHGAGAARTAFERHGASIGRGEGLQGFSYAIPTKSDPQQPLTLREIGQHVTRFLEYAREFPERQFAVTRIGCGLAGFDDHEIAPLFQDAPDNCHLPSGWREIAEKGPA